jgi:hypothetical protein
MRIFFHNYHTFSLQYCNVGCCLIVFRQRVLNPLPLKHRFTILFGQPCHFNHIDKQLLFRQPPIEPLNNKSHGLSPPGGFSSLFFDQVVPYYSQRHLANRTSPTLCIDKTLPGFLDVIPFHSLDVAIFVVEQLNIHQFIVAI